jgi:hypothetical protein
MRINLNTKEIASLLNISARSVEKNRSRLKKRPELSREDDLVKYITLFGKDVRLRACLNFHVSEHQCLTNVASRKLTSVTHHASKFSSQNRTLLTLRSAKFKHALRWIRARPWLLSGVEMQV